MLRVADQRRQIGIEMPRDLGRIDQPLQFEGLEPAKAIADDDPASRFIAHIGARPVQRSAEPYQRVAGLTGSGDRRPFARSAEHTSELQSQMRPSYAAFL